MQSCAVMTMVEVVAMAEDEDEALAARPASKHMDLQLASASPAR
jgi:hypothetical protein